MPDQGLLVPEELPAPGLADRLYSRYFEIKFRILKSLGARTMGSPYGIRLAANWDDLTFKFYSQGIYGYFLSNYVRKLDVPFVFLDVGANQGLYSILAARNRQCRRAYAFEPVPATAALLRENVRLNRCSDRCEIVQKAVSDVAGLVPIYLKSNHSGAASLGVRNDECERLDIEALDAVGLGRLVPPDETRIVVKIDAEGHEETVIEQILRSSLRSRVVDIFYECDERWINESRVRERLCAAGFNEFRKIGDGVHYDVLARRSTS